MTNDTENPRLLQFDSSAVELEARLARLVFRWKRTGDRPGSHGGGAWVAPGGRVQPDGPEPWVSSPRHGLPSILGAMRAMHPVLWTAFAGHLMALMDGRGALDMDEVEASVESGAMTVREAVSTATMDMLFDLDTRRMAEAACLAVLEHEDAYPIGPCPRLICLNCETEYHDWGHFDSRRCDAALRVQADEDSDVATIEDGGFVRETCGGHITYAA